MNRYVIGIIAMMASLTISCSDDASTEQLVDVTQRAPMTFAVSEEALTRLDNLDYINEASQLWSFTVVAQVDGKIFQQGNFIYNQVIDGFVPENGEIWLWPGDDTKEVTFYATNDLGWGKTQGINNSEPIVGDEYTFNNELGFHDLICAYKKAKRTDCQDGVVHLNFEHILTEVGILVRGEFPEGVPINGYNVTDITLVGADRQSYDFRQKQWTEDVDAENWTLTYFSDRMGYWIGNSGDSYMELYDHQMQKEGDTFRFLQPGRYHLTIEYELNGLRSKETDVELKKGQKNRIYLTLPYETR